jgi:hypothetical protein
MATSTGKYISVSSFRRLVTDLMNFSAKVPSVTIERRMGLAPLIAARQACTPSPTRAALITACSTAPPLRGRLPTWKRPCRVRS